MTAVNNLGALKPFFSGCWDIWNDTDKLRLLLFIGN